MVKFKKRVAKHKIGHFFQTTPLVIFFHCIDQNDFYKILTNSLILKNCNILCDKIKKEENFNIAEIKECIAEQGLIIKTVKNNYAKKAVMENQDFFKDFLYQQKEVSDLQKQVVQAKDFVLSREKSKKLTHSKKNIDKNSLFTGKNILMGFRDLNSLCKIKNFTQDKNIDILGAIYKDNIIDHNQIKRLALLSQDKQIYVHLINNLESCVGDLLNKVSKNLDFTYLQTLQHKLTILSKTLSYNKNKK